MPLLDLALVVVLAVPDPVPRTIPKSGLAMPDRRPNSDSKGRVLEMASKLGQSEAAHESTSVA